MSVFNISKKKKKDSTRRLIGIKSIEDYGIVTYSGHTQLYFIVKPTNLAVLSQQTIGNIIQSLTVVFKEIPDIQISCINSRESFDDNKTFLTKRISLEKNETVRSLLEKDIAFLERIQIQTASAREFIFNITLLKAEENEIYQTISRTLKLLNDQGFHAKVADKDDLKRIISVYLVQNMTNIYYDDFDGQRFSEYELKEL